MSQAQGGNLVTAETPLKVGDPVLIDWYGSWWDGEVLAVQEDGQVRVHYTGFDSRWDETVQRSRLALPPAAVTADTPLNPGDAIQIEWHGRWWPGSVVRLEGQKVRIRYSGYGDAWDETVPRTRVRLGGPENTAGWGGGGGMVLAGGGQYPPGPVRYGEGGAGGGRPVRARTALKAGDKVEIEQHGAWWGGEVVELLQDGRVKVHYSGWDSSWDEVVPRSRLSLDAPGVWEQLEGKPILLHLEGGGILGGTLVEHGDDYLLLEGEDGKRVLVNRAKFVYCEIEPRPL